MIDSMAQLGVGGAIMAKAFNIVDATPDEAFELCNDVMFTLGLPFKERKGLNGEILSELGRLHNGWEWEKASFCYLSD